MKNYAQSTHSGLGKIRNFITFGAVLTAALLFMFHYTWQLSPDRAQKRDRELEHIQSRDYEGTYCEQYALLAVRNGWYPCFRCNGRDSIYLLQGEVWKYGKTCGGEEIRYSGGLPINNLAYQIEFEGSEQECLLEEKQKIYNYPNLPECQKRNFILMRPPGNKIDR